GLSVTETRGPHGQRGAPGECANGDRQRTQNQRLHYEKAPAAAPRLSPHQHERRREREEPEEIRDRRHRSSTTALTEITPSANDPASSSGTRNSRNFATTVSSVARATTSTASLPARVSRPSSSAIGAACAGTPQGKNKLASRVRNTNSFIAEAHSTRARWRAEYSSSIASWIIVSSRCVAGLSTGRRPVSATMTMKN